jgi:membrane protease YdiL (CAAX protease family)
MQVHDYKMNNFWIYYLLAVSIAILGTLWMVLGNAVVYEALYGEPMLPDAYTFVGMMMQQAEARLGLPSDSIIASLSLMGKHWYMFPTYMFPAAPSIAAILVVWYFSRGAGVKALFSRFSPAQEGVSAARGLKLNGLIFLAIIAYALVLAALSGLSAEGGFAANIEGLRLDAPFLALVLLFVGSFTAHGAILEELGWRGFAWPLLQKVMKTPLHAAIFLGILWGAWHLPREAVMLAGGAPFDDFLLNQIDFFLMTITLTIIIGWAVNKAGGSILPAIMIHGASNYLGGSIDGSPVVFVFSTQSLMTLAVAIAIVVFAGKQLGYRGPVNAIGRSANAETAGA